MLPTTLTIKLDPHIYHLLSVTPDLYAVHKLGTTQLFKRHFNDGIVAPVLLLFRSLARMSSVDMCFAWERASRSRARCWVGVVWSRKHQQRCVKWNGTKQIHRGYVAHVGGGCCGENRNDRRRGGKNDEGKVQGVWR
jgi:hypothetical protein